MFNMEMICSDGIFQLCDDIFSSKLTEKEAETCVKTFYEDLKSVKSRIEFYNDISFNICIFWCNEEEKENILFNINLIKDVMFNMSDNIFKAFCEFENIPCPNHWYTLNSTVIALIDYKNSLFK